MRQHVAPTGRPDATVSEQGNRRIDRISRSDYVESLGSLSLEDLRERRDECLAEREYLSLLRRLVQGRAEILSGETQGPSRGEAVRVNIPEEEMLLARRRVERLVSDTGISDPGALPDDRLAAAVELLAEEERVVSDARNTVLGALDVLQDELKRRYKDDPSLVLT